MLGFWQKTSAIVGIAIVTLGGATQAGTGLETSPPNLAPPSEIVERLHDASKRRQEISEAAKPVDFQRPTSGQPKDRFLGYLGPSGANPAVLDYDSTDSIDVLSSSHKEFGRGQERADALSQERGSTPDETLTGSPAQSPAAELTHEASPGPEEDSSFSPSQASPVQDLTTEQQSDELDDQTKQPGEKVYGSDSVTDDGTGSADNSDTKRADDAGANTKSTETSGDSRAEQSDVPPANLTEQDPKDNVASVGGPGTGETEDRTGAASENEVSGGPPVPTDDTSKMATPVAAVAETVEPEVLTPKKPGMATSETDLTEQLDGKSGSSDTDLVERLDTKSEEPAEESKAPEAKTVEPVDSPKESDTSPEPDDELEVDW